MKKILCFLLLAIFFVYSCAVSKTKTEMTGSKYPYSDSQRRADYAAIVKGTDLEVKEDKQSVNIDTASYPFYIVNAGYRVCVYNIASVLSNDFYIDEDQQFIIKDTVGRFYPVVFGKKTGYVLKTGIGKKKGYSKEQIALASFNEETGTYTDEQTAYVRRKKLPIGASFGRDSSHTISNGSYSTGAKTVHVNGYTRKDGTVVHSYYRSAPSKH